MKNLGRIVAVAVGLAWLWSAWAAVPDDYLVICGNGTNTVIKNTNSQVNTLWVTVTGGEFRYSQSGVATTGCPVLANGYTLQWEFPVVVPPLIGIQGVSGSVTANVSRFKR